MNSLASGATLSGFANTIADERNKKRSIAIMIILMEVLVSILNGRDTNSYFKQYLCDVYIIYTCKRQRPIPYLFIYF